MASHPLPGFVQPRPPAALAGLWTSTRYGKIFARTHRFLPPRGAPAVILVHGMVISSRYMVPTAELLASLCRVYAVDLPGYGKSDKPWPILDLGGLADALAAWMDAVGIAKAHCIGNSFGCQILAEFAVRHAERVDRLVLQGPTVDAGARSPWRQLGRLLRNSRNEPNALGWISVKDYQAAGLRRAWATAKLVLNDRIEDKLPQIQAPTLVVRGGKDPLVPQAWAESVTRLLPHGELRVIPGVGHTINFAAPLPFVRVIRPFLQL